MVDFNLDIIVEIIDKDGIDYNFVKPSLDEKLSIQLDSLDVVELTMGIEDFYDEYDVDIPMEIINMDDSYSEFICKVNSKLCE